VDSAPFTDYGLRDAQHFGYGTIRGFGAGILLTQPLLISVQWILCDAAIYGKAWQSVAVNSQVSVQGEPGGSFQRFPAVLKKETMVLSAPDCFAVFQCYLKNRFLSGSEYINDSGVAYHPAVFIQITQHHAFQTLLLREGR
jgi:hypothetical protein